MGLQAETYDSPVDNLFVTSNVPVESESIVVASGQGVLTRGAVLGRITASSKGKLVDNAQTDGSQSIYAILAEDVDTTGGDVTSVVYLSGAFNSNALTFGGDDTAADHKDAARALSIYFKQAVPA